ncbi:MAG: hypothetical protein WC261_14290 [Synergistaceae bacterium]
MTKFERPTRVWINVPSALNPGHKYHGRTGIAYTDSSGITCVYFEKGPVTSMLFDPLYLSSVNSHTDVFQVNSECSIDNDNDPDRRFVNYYECACGKTWNRERSCVCVDRCPVCDKEIEPCQSEDTVLPDSLRERMLSNKAAHDAAHIKEEELFYEFLKAVGLDRALIITSNAQKEQVKRTLRSYIPNDSITKMLWFTNAIRIDGEEK